MKKITKKFLAIFLSVLMAVCAVSMPVSAVDFANSKSRQKKNYVEGEVIAVLKENAPQTLLSAKKTAGNFGNGIAMNDSFTISGKSGKIRAVALKSTTKTTVVIIKELKKNSAVKYAFPNYKKKASDISDDEYSSHLWALNNVGQNKGTAGLDINPEELWEKASSSEKEKVVAVVDTGVDFTHEDIKDVLWENPHGSKLLGRHGYDFTYTTKDRSPLDDNGHGTHVAGIIAASADNEKGISGVNKAQTKIMACKFLDSDGYGDTEAVLACFEYISRAIDLGTNIVAVNNSWSGLGDRAEQNLLDEIFDALGEKGAISVVSAGNDRYDLSALNDDEEFSFWYDDEDEFAITPACSESRYCLTVAATNEKDEIADFSNYSKDYIDISAPGCDILSTVSYNCFNPSIYTVSKKSELCKEIQGFEGSFTPTDFGYPNFFEIAKSGDELYDVLGKNQEVAVCGDGFGQSDKALKITFKDVVENEEDEEEAENFALYSFEIPYTIEDENKAYSYSFMIKGNNNVYGLVGDFPADYDIAENLDDAVFDSYIDSSADGGYWSHHCIDINPSEKGYPKKFKSKNRKLVFVAESPKTDSFIEIDDLAISRQNAEENFGKYDFYNGTSMAAPFVTGAVALVFNAYPEADAAEAINIIKNTGRKSASLEGKTENARVLSLNNCDKVPAMITSAGYNSKGEIEVKGSFKNDISFKINKKTVSPESITSSKAVFKDNSYNTEKTVIEAENEYGADSLTLLLSNKPSPKKSAKVLGMPSMAMGYGYYMPLGVKTVVAGEKSYYISEMGEVGALEYDDVEGGYIFNDFMPQIDMTGLFKEPKTVSVKDAVYLDGKIYFTAVNEIMSSYGGFIIGYEGAFACLDLTSGKTTVLCETPDPSALGDSLAVYNAEIYLIGGCSRDKAEFSNEIYEYNSANKAFDKCNFSLPEGRAFTTFIQYENKLIGVWGADEKGELPKIIVFDGAEFKTSAVKLSSDDYFETQLDTEKINVYSGSAGYFSNGLYLNGAYIYGFGDTYYYNAAKDKLSASKYSFSNEIGKNKLVATTLPGAFIAYPISDEEEPKPVGTSADDNGEAFAYCYGLNTNYAFLDISSVEHAYLTGEIVENFSYGDRINLKLSPEKGYVIKSISANGVKLSENSDKASFVVNSPNVH
ncbi:MAG: S8 family serine peptidase, partial [Eubacterium sp.]|nr:S8 family serine peptidase [Eubacterium sp.]